MTYFALVTKSRGRVRSAPSAPSEAPTPGPAGARAPSPGLTVPPAGRVSLPKYRAFFEALSGEPAEGTVVWRTALAGLVTLRYLDAWSEAAMSGRSLGFERDAVGKAIDALPFGAPERGLLAGLMDALGTDECDLTRVASLLLSYGRTLQQRTTWGMAADVYARVYATSAPMVGQPVHRELAASAALRMGQCYRRMGDTGAGDEAFRAALALGQMTANAYTVFKARLGLAQVTADLANLTSADDQLAAIIGDAVSDGAREARAQAWHERAQVAQRGGHSTEAIEYAYEAWVATRDPVARERILLDLASIAAAAGCPEIARDAEALLSETAAEPVVRWLATVHLMELATQGRRELDFSRHRRVLADVALPPSVAAEYVYQGALGDLAFGRQGVAVEALRGLAETAEKERLGDVLFRAEAALAGIGGGTLPPPPSPDHRLADRLRHIAVALESARSAASVAC